MRSVLHDNRIDLFCKKGVGYRDFLYLVAQPLLFSPDLLYKLWLNFRAYKYKKPEKQPSYLVVSDLLLSNLCYPIAGDLFKLHEDIQSVLSHQLDETVQYQIATFINEYAILNRYMISKNVYEIYTIWAKGILNPKEMEKEIIENLENSEDDYKKINYLSLYFNTLSHKPRESKIKTAIRLEVTKDINDKNILTIPLPITLKKWIKNESLDDEIEKPPIKNNYLQDLLVKPIIFLAFSNDERRPLSSLVKERLEIEKIFETLYEQGECELIIEAEATLEDIFRVFSHRKNRNRIAVFHYAGHMNRGDSINNTVYSKEVNRVRLLEMQKNLKLVFLNESSTIKEAEFLQSQGVENVIATVKTIEDNTAAIIAEKFYEVFVQNNSIKKSFENACAFMKSEKDHTGNTRKLLRNYTDSNSEFPWVGIFKNGNWRLSNYKPIRESLKVFLVYSSYDEKEKRKLDRQLMILKRRGFIDIFSSTGVEIGKNVQEIIIEHLYTSQIVLLFVTENLFYDAYELVEKAIELYEHNSIMLIPIYVNKCVLEGEKLAQLEPLPRKHLHNGQIWRFVNEWNNEDMAYYEIAKGLRDIIISMKQE